MKPLAQWTYWGRITHISVNKLNIFVSDNGLSPSRRKFIIRTDSENINWSIGKNLQGKIFIQENALENYMILKAILSPPQYAKDRKYTYAATLQCISLTEQQVVARGWVVDIILPIIAYV